MFTHADTLGETDARPAAAGAGGVCSHGTTWLLSRRLHLLRTEKGESFVRLCVCTFMKHGALQYRERTRHS